MSLRLLVASILALVADGAQWGVITAGSNGYENYRHQADACHAYQVLKAKGVPEENIILLAYDDIAHNRENPIKGKLFNKPDRHGPGKDVYAGCKIDYKGKQVTPKNFLNVLTGQGSGKVLKSTAEDEVFVFFSDHGAPGLIAFPSSELHKKQLQSALKTMHTKKMFKKLVFYLESCESGSMFKGLNTPGVYAVSASNPKESSWGFYCDKPYVNGKNLNTCLGDLFSISWLEDSDAKDVTSETLEQQFEAVQKRTSKSHVMQWGDKSFTQDDVSEFIGSKANRSLNAAQDLETSERDAVSTRSIDLHRRFMMYSNAETSHDRLAAGRELQAELARQVAAESTYLRFAEIAFPGDAEKQMELRRASEEPENVDCELAGHASIRTHCADKFDANSGFALQFHQVVVNVCAAISRGLNLDVEAAAQQACSGQDAKVVV